MRRAVRLRRLLRPFAIRAPRTLLWRIFLLVATLMIASVAVWWAFASHVEERSRAREMGQMVVSIVNLTRSALLNADPARRKDLLLDLATIEGIRIYPSEANDRIAPLADTPLMAGVTDEVRRQLGPQTRFASAWEGLGGFWVSFRLDADAPEADGDEFWVMLPTDRVLRPHALELLGWGSVALALAMLGTYRIVSRLARPLKALAAAARTVGRGEVPPRLEERGPAEITEVARAFNQMSRDLQRLDADRALILAGVSHDLRTPLARLRLGVELSGASDEDVAAMVADIEDMDRIIHQFLAFARDDGGGEARANVDLGALALDLAAQYALRGTGIALRPPAAPCVALARPLALRRALVNLIDNVLRYGGGSQPEIECGASPDGRVRISVLDRGPGIAEADLERVKLPFTRLEAARSNTEGSGLGLAIVERIARGQDGEFVLQPREGGGLAASILLPRATAA